MKYDKYKDSGVDWIGEIPDHWEVKRLKYLADSNPSNVDKKSKEGESEVMLCNYMDVYKNEFITDDLDFMKATASKAQIDKFSLIEGDVIATKDSESQDDIAVPAVVKMNLDNVICGYHLNHIRPKAINGFYLFRLFQSQYFKSYFEVSSNGVTRYGIGAEKFANVRTIVPPEEEQKKIVEYLDKKTSEIDTLIKDKQKLLNLYEEEKQAIINEAVLKGINPDVPMKDSGIEWIGEVPEHWEVTRLKYLCLKMISGPFGSSLKKDSYTKTGFKIYGQEQVIKGDIKYGTYYIPLEKYRAMSRYRVDEDDILISCVGTFGKILRIPKEFEKGIINPRLIKLTLDSDEINPEYFAEILKSNFVKEQLASLSRGGTMGVINLDLMRQIVLPRPPLNEQADILSRINELLVTKNLQIKDCKNVIELLGEYRTGLINETITGKIKL